MVYSELSEDATRTIVFVTLISANLFLTLVNRSFHYSILTTLTYKNNLLPIIILITLVLTVLLLAVPEFNHFFNFEILRFSLIIHAVAIGFLSVIWYELIKCYNRYQIK
jgi:Ca2+-transporting ATPase